MTGLDQHDFDLRCEWGMAGIRHLVRTDAIVIVDVLSFSTSVDIALARGAIVLPYRWRDDSAAEFAREQNAVLAGKRGADGFSLAPSSLVNAPRGLRLVLPSPNGSSLAYAAKSGGAVIMAGCLRNANAVAARAQRAGKQITVIPAGEQWPDGALRPAVEDLIGAGAILSALPGMPSPEAQAAIAAFQDARADLLNRLLASTSGRELAARGYHPDIELAAEFNISPTAPELIGHEFTDSAAARDMNQVSQTGH